MVSGKNIDMNDLVTIYYLRPALIKYLKKLRDCVFPRESDYNAVYNNSRAIGETLATQLNPEQKAARRSRLTNILFFVGSLFGPEFARSEWLGRQKPDPRHMGKYNSIVQMNADTMREFGSLSDALHELICGIDEATKRINKENGEFRLSDMALVGLFNELRGQYASINNPLRSFTNAMVKCGYINNYYTEKICGLNVIGDDFKFQEEFLKMCENIDEQKNEKLSKEEKDRYQFVSQIALFSNKHALQDNASDQLYEYVAHKLESPVFIYGTVLRTDEDRIKYENHGAACSGIGDCEGIEWDITWSITYMGTDGEYDVDNERLKNTSRYYNGANNVSHDEFFCKDPFGLDGIYKIQYNYEENDA